uniref:Uncharacterized protein n=1 Tax=Chromera velia CCMP2878 TaxID=1169474 RepID=A0A0G4HE83_9ALVE|eukprot:Cvel_26698.t1-p1 / transcript=Cvel_26698.t1 / gene=Cvel_26698 / organism=Chromera_velia_CCMP2878 / gene_product=hypothetical protein / transcript_product=hypothetical protein / location=Cvel_scaffold3216:10311-17457(+) / protein_length=686 / sequence_SO=supercontig / SO=protein_coding / is_pseudo=false
MDRIGYDVSVLHNPRPKLGNRGDGTVLAEDKANNMCQYPQIGAFEVYVQARGKSKTKVFSKLELGKWPNVEKLAERVEKFLGGSSGASGEEGGRKSVTAPQQSERLERSDRGVSQSNVYTRQETAQTASRRGSGGSSSYGGAAGRGESSRSNFNRGSSAHSNRRPSVAVTDATGPAASALPTVEEEKETAWADQNYDREEREDQASAGGAAAYGVGTADTEDVVAAAVKNEDEDQKGPGGGSGDYAQPVSSESTRPTTAVPPDSQRPESPETFDFSSARETTTQAPVVQLGRRMSQFRELLSTFLQGKGEGMGNAVKNVIEWLDEVDASEEMSLQDFKGVLISKFPVDIWGDGFPFGALLDELKEVLNDPSTISFAHFLGLVLSEEGVTKEFVIRTASEAKAQKEKEEAEGGFRWQEEAKESSKEKEEEEGGGGGGEYEFDFHENENNDAGPASSPEHAEMEEDHDATSRSVHFGASSPQAGGDTENRDRDAGAVSPSESPNGAAAHEDEREVRRQSGGLQPGLETATATAVASRIGTEGDGEGEAEETDQSPSAATDGPAEEPEASQHPLVEPNREYELELPYNEEKSQRLSYDNVLEEDLNLKLESSDPARLVLSTKSGKPTDEVSIPALGKGKFHFRFLPVPEPCMKEYFLYVKDQESNEIRECIRIQVDFYGERPAGGGDDD